MGAIRTLVLCCTLKPSPAPSSAELLGQPSSVCKMVLERLDAELSETDDEGRLRTAA